MSSYGFFPASGTDYSQGDEPAIARALGRLGRALHLHLTGISGYRTPAHSVAVGGFANDPHTRGQASDTPGIERVSEATLNRFGLTRPFGGAKEANHIQLMRSRSSTSRAASGHQAVVNQAATNWGVPANILTGVWGMETNFGQNVATSSAGAIGDFQFLPSTAKGRGYPLTNSPNEQQFAQQANAAAKYLRELRDQYGSWDAALRHYSGGGYGLSQVQQKAPRGRNFGTGPAMPRIRPGGQPSGDTEAPDVTAVLSDWADAQSADPTASAGGGNQFASFPIPGLGGPLGILPGIPNPLDLFKNLSGSINSVTDFLKVVAWIINPVNILRAVEVLIGLVLMAFGFQAMLQAYGERREGFVTSENALSRSGLGRVSREVANAVTTAVPEARAAKVAKAGTGAKSAKASSSTRVRKPRSAPHKSRREALRLRYEREETRRAKR